jgi:hypothetical protein
MVEHKQTEYDTKMAFRLIMYSVVVLLICGYLLLGTWPADTGDLELNATSTFNHTRPAFNAINDINSTRPISLPFTETSFLVGPETLLVIVMIISGAMGAAIFSLWAAAKHLSYKHNFDYDRYKYWYMTRPFLGSGLALFFYFLIRGGLLTIGTEIMMMNVVVIAGLSGLVGMFSEQAILKLSEIADATFGSKKATEAEEAEETKKQAIAVAEKAKKKAAAYRKEADKAVKEADKLEAENKKKEAEAAKARAKEAAEKANTAEEEADKLEAEVKKLAKAEADKLEAEVKRLREEAEAGSK